VLKKIWKRKFVILAVVGWVIIGSLLYISERRERKVPEKADLVYHTFFNLNGG